MLSLSACFAKNCRIVIRRLEEKRRRLFRRRVPAAASTTILLVVISESRRTDPTETPSNEQSPPPTRLFREKSQNILLRFYASTSLIIFCNDHMTSRCQLGRGTIRACFPKSSCRYIRAIRGIPGFTRKGMRRQSRSEFCGNQIRKVGAPHLTFFVVVFEYGAKNHGDGSGCYNTDACILAMVVGKESRLLEKKLWCAVVGCSGTDSARVLGRSTLGPLAVKVQCGDARFRISSPVKVRWRGISIRV